MELLASLFVRKPLNILAVAFLFIAGYAAMRSLKRGGERRPPQLLLAASAWILYAAWELMVRSRTPEADIRVDLLLIWPALAVISAWSLYRSLRPGSRLVRKQN